MRMVRALSASARATAWRIHHVAYVENLNPLRWSNFSAARTRPIVPSWIRSRKGRPWLRYFFAIETTRRRFASTISCFAPWSPRSIRFASSTSRAAVSSVTLPMSFRKRWSESAAVSAAALASSWSASSTSASNAARGSCSSWSASCSKTVPATSSPTAFSPCLCSPASRASRDCDTGSGRMYGPYGSFVTDVGPTPLHARQELFHARKELFHSREELGGGAAEVGLKSERDRLPELDDRLVALSRPREQQAEVEADDLAARKPARERAEARERGRQVVLVEARDGGGDLRVVVAGREPGGTVVDAPRRVLVP